MAKNVYNYVLYSIHVHEKDVVYKICLHSNNKEKNIFHCLTHKLTSSATVPCQGRYSLTLEV